MHPTWILIFSVPVPCLFQVRFFGLHKGKDPILHVKVASLLPHHQADVYMLYALLLFIREEYDEYGCMHPTWHHLVERCCQWPGFSDRWGRSTACSGCIMAAQSRCPQGGGLHSQSLCARVEILGSGDCPGDTQSWVWPSAGGKTKGLMQM